MLLPPRCLVPEVPSLRERREDMAVLADCFREQANHGYGLAIEGMSRDALAILEADDWPGNVRDLEAVVKRAMISRRRGRVTPQDVTLPKLRWQRLPEAVLALGTSLIPAQRQALRLCPAVARCGAGTWWRAVGSRGRRPEGTARLGPCWCRPA